MVWIVTILVITNIYFSTRLFYIKKDIKEAKENLQEVFNNKDSNRKIKFKYPDKDFEELLSKVNLSLEEYQKARIKYINKETKIKKEIENISHDLRTPLTSICGYLEILNEEDISEDKRKKYISIVEKRAYVLQNLIESFYDLSRIELDDYRMDMEIIDINKELRELLLMFYNDFQSKGIEVDISLMEGILKINVNKRAIQRVFTNIIRNSIKYSKSKFYVDTKKVDGKAVIKFSNDTDDLSKEEEQLIFDRFYMKDSARNNNSSGLGLTVAKALVEKMGGKINAKISDNNISFIIEYNIS